MKALSVQQPWAGAIVRLGKDVENRTWPTRYRGPLLIQATRKEDPSGRAALSEILRPDEIAAADFETGAAWALRGIVGVVDVVDCVRGHASRWTAADQYQWVLANPREITSAIPCAGSLGLWDAPDDIGRVALERVTTTEARLRRG